MGWDGLDPPLPEWIDPTLETLVVDGSELDLPTLLSPLTSVIDYSEASTFGLKDSTRNHEKLAKAVSNSRFAEVTGLADRGKRAFYWQRSLWSENGEQIWRMLQTDPSFREEAPCVLLLFHVAGRRWVLPKACLTAGVPAA